MYLKGAVTMPGNVKGGESEPLSTPFKCAYGTTSPGLPFHLYQECMENIILEKFPRCITVWTKGTRPELGVERVSDDKVLEDLRASGLSDTPQNRDFIRTQYADRNFGLRFRLDREMEQLFSLMWGSLTLEGQRAIRIMPESPAVLESCCPIALRSLIIKTHCTSDRGHAAPMSDLERRIAARDAYYDCIMREGESVYEYALRFGAALTHFKELDAAKSVPSDEAQARDFLRGTLDSAFMSLKKELRNPNPVTNTPKTLNEAFRLAMAWIPPSGTPLAPLLMSSDHIKNDLHTSSNNSGSVAAVESKDDDVSRSSDPPPAQAAANVRSKATRNPTKAALFCDFCMRKGHISAECFHKHPKSRVTRAF